MIKVLQVFPHMNNAGTEMVIMNWYRNIDRSKIQFDFLVQEAGELDEEIRLLGGTIHYLPKGNDYHHQVLSFLKKNKSYDIIHTHTHKEMGDVLKVAKNAKVPVRIAHSHNSRKNINIFIKSLKKISSLKIKKNATHFFACSEDAAKWLFPYKKLSPIIIKNGIDLDKFSYNEESRKKIRKELKISENIPVLCHVGRFADQKNHLFLTDICADLINNLPNLNVILVGVGPLFEEIKEKVKALNMENNFHFLGNRKDVNEILSASDIFVFPSKYEGLGIVLIESQASGLDCVFSEAIPSDAILIRDNCSQLSLSKSARDWSKTIEKSLLEKNDRENSSKNIKEFGYDIVQTTQRVEEFYLSSL